MRNTKWYVINNTSTKGLFDVGRAVLQRLQFRAATPNNARISPDQPNPNQQYHFVVFLITNILF